MLNHRQSIFWMFPLAALTVLCGCATPDAPQPPSLRIPNPVTDLHAVRTADHVLVSWTAPAQTTDDENIRRPGTTRVCRDLNATEKCTALTETPSLIGKPQQYTDTIPAELLQKPGLLVYHVEVLNPVGRRDQPSNAVVVPIGPTLPAPASIKLEPRRTGIAVHWQSASVPNVEDMNFSYRIMRRDAGSKSWTVLSTIPASSTDTDLAYTDTAPVFGHDYQYTVLGLSRFARNGKDYEIEGEPSAPQDLAFRDLFPPAAPMGLQAVYGGVPGQDAIDLSWNPEQERELAGYNIYRHESTGAPARVNNELVAGTSYHDSTVTPGRKYFYSITAVDAHGVESKYSDEASESVPAASQK